MYTDPSVSMAYTLHWQGAKSDVDNVISSLEKDKYVPGCFALWCDDQSESYDPVTGLLKSKNPKDLQGRDTVLPEKTEARVYVFNSLSRQLLAID
jgi:hypothetical protein